MCVSCVRSVCMHVLGLCAGCVCVCVCECVCVACVCARVECIVCVQRVYLDVISIDVVVFLIVQFYPSLINYRKNGEDPGKYKSIGYNSHSSHSAQ